MILDKFYFLLSPISQTVAKSTKRLPICTAYKIGRAEGEQRRRKQLLVVITVTIHSYWRSNLVI